MRDAKVLIVDDEVEFATALSERLQLRNYAAKAVFCAEDAFAITKAEQPDLMLLDLKMPGMHGREIVKTVKQFSPGIQVIILTGVSEDQILEEGIEGEVFDCIMKPVDISVLTQKIDEALKKRN